MLLRHRSLTLLGSGTRMRGDAQVSSLSGDGVGPLNAVRSAWWDRLLRVERSINHRALQGRRGPPCPRGPQGPQGVPGPLVAGPADAPDAGQDASRPPARRCAHSRGRSQIPAQPLTNPAASAWPTHHAPTRGRRPRANPPGRHAAHVDDPRRSRHRHHLVSPRVGGLEVGQEVVVWLYGDDPPVLCSARPGNSELCALCDSSGCLSGVLASKLSDFGVVAVAEDRPGFLAHPGDHSDGRPT